jgi:predicted nucleic acid-binding protein
VSGTRAGLTADTSVVVAALSSWHADHEPASLALEGITALPLHVTLEAYSVLTRLPAGLAVPAVDAADVLARRFGDSPLALPELERSVLTTTLAQAGVFGGASYDGLVGLEARAHGRVLLSIDHRAEETYRRLGVAFRRV